MATASLKHRGMEDTGNRGGSLSRATAFLWVFCFLWPPDSGAAAPHWAFIPPTREPGRNIDWFIGQQLRGRGIDFSRTANRFTLARRAALVLTGLPLAPGRVRGFADDEQADAEARLIDELLASERFGEHQARYWLDAVRYADTHGRHMDNRRAIHPYRDWVVRAFNSNLPLSHFIKWQIAGDLYSGRTTDHLIATGFIRLNPTTGEDGSLYEEYQAINSFDRVETLGTALLGMTFSCARCHDHKYDPITQEDYFRLFACFNNTAEDSLDDGGFQYEPVIRVPKDPAARKEWNALLEERRKKDVSFRAGFPGVIPRETGWTTSNWRLSRELEITSPKPAEHRFYDVPDLPGRSSEHLPVAGDKARWVSFRLDLSHARVIWLRYGSGPGHQLDVDGVPQTNHARFLPLDLAAGGHTVTLKLTGSVDRDPLEVYVEDSLTNGLSSGLQLTERGEKDPAVLGMVRGIAAAEDRFAATLIAQERDPPRTTRILKRGRYDRPIGRPLVAGIPAVWGGLTNHHATNRLGLARWLTDRSNPLTARVLVNRMWQQVFGAGLVRTPEDFGTRGEPPTHPELLDWLAVELMDSGWNMKHVLRRMVTSRTFRQESEWRREVDDPENRLWARGPRYRLDAEVIRDAGLWAGGLLDLRMGGEGVKPWQPEGLWEELAHPKSNTRRYLPDGGKVSHRRSLYLYWKRSSPHPMMTLFDAPTREVSCVRRSRSNTAAQSLALLNERQRVEMARAIAGRIATGSGNRARVVELYRLLAGREPRAAEINACRALLADLRRHGSETEVWPKVVIAVMASDAAITLN